jgi:TRAP-type mannitol/chloroaromatic compound transport system substrate-binding protein
MKNGVKLRSFSKTILDACSKAANEVSQKNPKFKKVFEQWRRFQREQNQWYSVAELPIQNYLASRNR